MTTTTTTTTPPILFYARAIFCALALLLVAEAVRAAVPDVTPLRPVATVSCIGAAVIGESACGDRHTRASSLA